MVDANDALEDLRRTRKVRRRSEKRVGAARCPSEGPDGLPQLQPMVPFRVLGRIV